jgi:hypothetical protein
MVIAQLDPLDRGGRHRMHLDGRPLGSLTAFVPRIKRLWMPTECGIASAIPEFLCRVPPTAGCPSLTPAT